MANLELKRTSGERRLDALDGLLAPGGQRLANGQPPKPRAKAGESPVAISGCETSRRPTPQVAGRSVRAARAATRRRATLGRRRARAAPGQPVARTRHARRRRQRARDLGRQRAGDDVRSRSVSL